MLTPPPVYGAPPPARPPRNRRGLLLGLSAAALALVVAITAVAVVTSRGGAHASPQDAARAYLEALARGDAEAALALGKNQPSSTELLTDEILRRQTAEWPITDIQILSGDQPTSTTTRVHVSAKFGDTVSDTELTMNKTADGWKVAFAAVKIDIRQFAGSNQALKTMTVFGRSTDNPLYVFPGWVDVSTNPNLTVTVSPVLLDDLTNSTVLTDTEFELSTAAKQSVLDSVAEKLATCSRSNLLSPPGCPVRVRDTQLVEGTAKWGAFDEVGQTQVLFSAYTMSGQVFGTVKSTFAALTRSGTPLRTIDVAGSVHATVSLETAPPTVTYQ